MRYTESEITDAEFRVITRSRWNSWMEQLPNRGDRVAFMLVAVAALALIGGLLTGFHAAAFLSSLSLAGIGCLASVEHKGKGAGCIALAFLIGTSGCSKEAAPEPPRAMLASEKIKTPEEVQSSIREATRYKSPREGWKPKPMQASVVMAEATPPAQEQTDEDE